MSGRILIVDSVATNRIILRATLQAAHYDVTPCASLTEAEEALARSAHDIALIDICGNPPATLAFCTRTKADPAQSALRIIALAGPRRPGRADVEILPDPRSPIHRKPPDRDAPPRDGSDRIAALRAGADNVLDRDAAPALLLASIRALLRARNQSSELTLRDESDRLPGFADAKEGFTGAGRVALISPRPTALPAVLRMVLDRQPGPTSLHTPGENLPDGAASPPADLYIIDGADVSTRGMTEADLFRIISELRARAPTRHAATLVMLPPDAPDQAAMALDLGANDQVTETVSVDELSHRVRHLMRRKLRDDRQRDDLQSQLQAANIDPLTGLYNRRYAQRRLERMAQAARTSGSEFAVMVLDIDHFKAINDTYGHATGDRVLTQVAHRLRDNLRAVDLVARIGGEEFLVAMPDTSIDRAGRAAERLRQIIDARLFDLAPPPEPGVLPLPPTHSPEKPGLRVTLSIGVAIGTAGADPATMPQMLPAQMIACLFESADSALYQAKSAGRNTVTIARSAA